MLSDLNISLYVSLGFLTIFLSSIVAIAFISSKELRQHPSGLLASLSISEVVMAYHSIIFALGSRDYIRALRVEQILVLGIVNNENSVDWLCGTNQIILSAATISCICYNIAICLDLVITLYNPLIPGSVRKRWYHMVTFCAVTYFTVFVNTINDFVSKCESNPSYRLEIMNTASVNILLMIYLAIGITSIIYSAYRFANGLKLESEATTKYLVRHVVYVSLFIFCWVLPAISYIMKNYVDHQNGDVDTVAIATTSSSGFFLGLIRISDPVVWKRIRRITTLDANKKNEDDDAWTQPISVVVQGKLNTELTHCIFESLHYIFLHLKGSKIDEDAIENSDYRRKKTHKITENMRPMTIWGVRDSKIDGVELDTYAPDIFINIIEKSGISIDEILHSLDPANNIENKVDESAGKSGSFFLFTKDKRLSIKTIKRSERQIMCRFLKDYHEHLTIFRNSLLCRIFGVFVLKIPGVAAVDILLMQNVFYGLKPLRVYDIKGSTAGRSSKKMQEGPLKDLDFLNSAEKLILRKEDINEIEFNLLKDLKLLKSMKLMDYSMLIGISDCSENSNIEGPNFRSIDGQQVYTFGIIDFLTQYGYLKSLERSFTALRYGKNVKKASVANPSMYSNRFFNFIFSVIIPITRRSSSFVIKDD